MVIYSPQNKFRLIHKKSGKIFSINENITYLDYDETKFNKENQQNNLFIKY